MRTGGPAFGTPESVLGTLAGGQLARRYGLPYRGGGGLCSSNSLDAASAAETTMTLWATMLAGSHLVMHAAGWLEGGLTASYEKFAIDLELLRMFAMIDEGIETSEERFAIEAMREEGPGGMFLAADHTLAHFREWMFMSPLFRSQAYVTWEKQGSATTDHAGHRRVEEAARELRGSRHRRRPSTRSCRSTCTRRRAEIEASPLMARGAAPRHPVRAGPDRAEDAAKPVLPGASLHRLRRREAVDAGRLPRA